MTSCTAMESMTAYQVARAAQLNDTVTLNVGGTRFEVTRLTLSRFPESKLGSLDQLPHHYRADADEYYFDRSPFLFDVVLNFYRFGELHLPSNLCSVSVRKELEYWQVSDVLMEDCCWVPYNSQMMKISSLKKFKQCYISASHLDVSGNKATCSGNWWKRTQPKVWAFLDEHDSSYGAKVFAIISVLLVLLTTFTFVAETLPQLKQNVTTKNPDLETDGVSYDKPTTSIGTEGANLTEGDSAPPNDRKKQKRSVSLAAVLSGSVPLRGPSFSQANSLNRRRRDVNNTADLEEEKPKTSALVIDEVYVLLSAPKQAFEITDIIAYAFFTVELLLRIIFCPVKLEFFKNGLNIIDILALLPYYIEITVHSLYEREKYQETFLDALYILRIVRIFRIFRMVRHYRGLKVLVYTLKASAREITLMMIFLSLGMLIFSSLIYYTKGPEDVFNSIPHAFWWAVITMTTVGYGDMVPKTGAGYFIGAFCALSGVLVISFTVPVIVNNFMLFYQHVEYNRRKKHVEEANKYWSKHTKMGGKPDKAGLIDGGKKAIQSIRVKAHKHRVEAIRDNKKSSHTPVTAV